MEQEEDEEEEEFLLSIRSLSIITKSANGEWVQYVCLSGFRLKLNLNLMGFQRSDSNVCELETLYDIWVITNR